MSATEPKPWEVWDLPEREDRENDPEEEWEVTPAGQVRAYFDGELMMALHDGDFSVGFESEPGEPAGLVFDAPIARFPDEEPQPVGLRTLLTSDEIPIEEVDHPDENTRKWVPTDAVDWTFEITTELTPYTDAGWDDV